MTRSALDDVVKVPIHLGSVKISGIAASSGRPGEMMTVITRYAGTSDNYTFHRIASGIVDVLAQNSSDRALGSRVEGASFALAVIKADESAQLYLDNTDVVMSARIKRDVKAGEALYLQDISDIISIDFPNVEIASEDQVIVLFRERFRHALYVNLGRNFDRGDMTSSLGRLLRYMRYTEAYAVQSNPELFDILIARGWFPFIEINHQEFAHIFGALDDETELDKVELSTVEAFTASRVEAMLERWLRQPAFRRREAVLRVGVEAFLAGSAIAAIKTLITEIEGVLQDAHIEAKGLSAKTRDLVEFATSNAIARAGASDTLSLPPEFQRYLMLNIFESFDPLGTDRAARHSVSHGSAPPEAYTMRRALQVLLTLDQISFLI
ncbi:hypothetical protein [Caulobacter segnis]|uniref:hypothetical protein n=1 Tax=Caulobacter segnis TaxID=88688 RepID=UPI0028601979|nr:hypothetical protein [Caulobacter segnis]MDR6626948.1 hypothetical protein [Caulobacter segnis]